ncbi:MULTISPECIES: DEAD/DEAH box helicase family protein [unclassified Ruminococcus]|uniref:restriction endonuclease n=1 Tax=unclassified Ruminococcus TaxID=2608920 RepID=UPI00210CD7FA|nr:MULTISPECIES: DEAD/DEAH box helicase family protein [unclassified Ruminococcus]MCQ4022356.1 type III deoxyribonuclease [Ruminococcus sp. zg-924]MCQ4114684.1 type III deoxyribonuclease [Ruminococcus sp. zg-921]
MKLKFKKQGYQSDATAAVVDLFSGQERTTSTFTVMQEQQISLLQNDFGVGNAQLIDDQAMLENLHGIQKRFNLPLTDEIDDKRFCVEMETGTGKTYVYTQTILELNRKYGFTKFIIVVPSVAIREGVYKSFEITKDHFAALYDNVPYRYFIYNSAKLSDVRQFATGANIEIMIINIDAFKKAENIINQAQDKLNGETAMRYIQDTNPIVIVDEPQSVDNTPKAKEAIASLNPLCVLRYSATHREKINTVFRLTPVDAYQMGLVKQICVSSVSAENDFNKPYIRLLEVSQKDGFKAKVQIDIKAKDGKVARKTVTIKPNSDLYVLSGEREFYDGYTVSGIDCTPGRECIEFANTEILKLGQAIGDIDDALIKREQIRKTIEIHLDKELMLSRRGIKVLSLFFIDKVEKYRTEDGGMGIYAQMFEECYNELINRPKYAELKEKYSDAHAAHNGYFSQDKKGAYKDTKGDTIADYDTYNTIMKDKEWLLSFDCPLRFIWSHSALKEGWDNPNVFQVCTLIDQKSTFTCRQKIGRGLRLCVDQTGERIENKDVNLLHVIANESFAEFAETLQKEIEDETGLKFGMIQISMFSGMIYEEQVEHEHTIDKEEAHELVKYWTESGMLDKWMADPEMIAAEEKITVQLESGKIEAPPSPVAEVMRQIKMGATPEQAATAIVGITANITETVEREVTYDDAKEIVEHFEKKGYISKSGKMKDTMKNALLTGTLDLPKKYEAARERFESIIKKADSKPPIRDASRDVVVKLKKQVIVSPEFLELWNSIKHKTTYRVKIDTDELIERCVKDFQDLPAIPKMRLVSQTADIDIANYGVTHTAREYRSQDIQNDNIAIPNIVTVISEQTLVNRRVVLEIIEKSGRGKEMLRNPQMFIEQLSEVIQNNCYQLDIDGISYQRLAGEDYYVQEIFETEELMANLDRNAVEVNKSVYDYVVYDSSTIEKPFAVALDSDPDVKLFFKIPERFKIQTPIGTYNPDWAVYLTKNGEEKLYFVLETKGSTSLFDLRTREQLKIHCGKKHFKALNSDVEMQVAAKWDDFKSTI